MHPYCSYCQLSDRPFGSWVPCSCYSIKGKVPVLFHPTRPVTHQISWTEGLHQPLMLMWENEKHLKMVPCKQHFPFIDITFWWAEEISIIIIGFKIHFTTRNSQSCEVSCCYFLERRTFSWYIWKCKRIPTRTPVMHYPGHVDSTLILYFSPQKTIYF